MHQGVMRGYFIKAIIFFRISHHTREHTAPPTMKYYRLLVPKFFCHRNFPPIAATDSGYDAADGLEVVGEFPSDVVHRGVLLSCPDGAVVGCAGTMRVPRLPDQEFLSCDASFRYRVDAQDDSSMSTPVALPQDARDNTHAPHPSPRRPALSRCPWPSTGPRAYGC